MQKISIYLSSKSVFNKSSHWNIQERPIVYKAYSIEKMCTKYYIYNTYNSHVTNDHTCIRRVPQPPSCHHSAFILSEKKPTLFPHKATNTSTYFIASVDRKPNGTWVCSLYSDMLQTPGSSIGSHWKRNRVWGSTNREEYKFKYELIRHDWAAWLQNDNTMVEPVFANNS